MHHTPVVGAGNDLHRRSVRAIGADDLDRSICAEQHGVPVEHRLVAQRGRVAAKQVHHHHGDAALGGVHAGTLGANSELVAQRGLDTRAIEDFPLDLGGLYGLVADELDF